MSSLVSVGPLVPLLAYSIWLVKVRRAYARHRNLQCLLAVILALAVTAFEVDMRLHGGWKNIVNKDASQPRLDGAELVQVQQYLYVHLVFAISTPFLWGATLWLGWKRFPNPPLPGAHSKLHKNLGWASAVDLALTSVTGLWFYYSSFISH